MTDKANRRPSPTISQVAAAAGVSRSTVSRVFSRPDSISQATIRRVKTIAEQLGYMPNQTARALSTGRHRNIAVIVPDVANPFFPPLIAAAQDEADRHDYCVFLGNSGENAEREDQLVHRLGGQVEGLVLVSSRMSDQQIAGLAERRPLVLVNRDLANIPRVLIDSAKGTQASVEHLASLGHKSVVYVNGPGASWSNRQRRNAVRRAAAANQIKMKTVACQTPTFESGRQVVPQIAATGARAVIAFDDLVAQGILAGLAENSIRVPRDFSVVGCDDVLGAATYPALTTVSNCSEAAGRAACRLLMDMLETSAFADVRYVMDTHLVFRNTTGPAPNP